MPTGTPPAARALHEAALDVADNHMIVFGGSESVAMSGLLRNDVWVLSNPDGVTGTPGWTQLLPMGAAPSPRIHAGMAYDPVTNRLILFGGNPNYGSCSSAVNDTWILENANGQGGATAWTQVAPVGMAPSPRSTSVVGHDPASDRMVVFGGWNPCNPVLADTWVLTSASDTGGSQTWVQLAPTGALPVPGTRNMRGAYDAASNRLIVMPGDGIVDAVWVLQDATGLSGMTPVVPNWTQLAPAGTPPDLGLAGLVRVVYDPANNRAILYGSAVNTDVFVLDGANGLAGTPAWSVLPIAGPRPSERDYISSVHVPASNRMVVFGGRACQGPAPMCPSAIVDEVWTLQLPDRPTCGVMLPGPTVTGEASVGVDAVARGTPAIDVLLEFSTDGGATFQPCTMAATSPNPNPTLGTAPGIVTLVWDSEADAVGLGPAEPGVFVRATISAGPLLGTCSQTVTVDNRECRGICGDCNENGQGPNLLDALAAAQVAVGLISPSPMQAACCDVNSSGATDIVDALMMAQLDVGLPVVPACR